MTVPFVILILILLICLQNPERKHRTSVFVLVVTEELDEWEDSKNIGNFCIV